jgi:hypothetical protein
MRDLALVSPALDGWSRTWLYQSQRRSIMIRTSTLWASALVAFALAGPALAHKDTPNIQGEHDMTGTGDLHLHFPPDTVKDLKDGDKITVHLGFTKE